MIKRDYSPFFLFPRLGVGGPGRIEGRGPEVKVLERGWEPDFRSLEETGMRVGATWGGSSGSGRLRVLGSRKIRGWVLGPR